MDQVVVFAAKYMLWLMVAGFAAVWLFGEKMPGRVRMAGSAVIGLVLVLILIKICSSLYFDPRPFARNPSIVPLIPHAPDNGFPSDHSAAAGLIAMLVALRHRWWGIAFAAAMVAVAWGRVAAHVHHLLDVVTGIALGTAAALVATFLVAALLRRIPLPAWAGGVPAVTGTDDEPHASSDRGAAEAPHPDRPPGDRG